MGTDGNRLGGKGEEVLRDTLDHDTDLAGTIASAYRAGHDADPANQCLTAHPCSLAPSARAGSRG